MTVDHRLDGLATMLAQIPYLSGLAPDALSDIACQARRRSFEMGQVIFGEGDPCPGLYVLETGWVQVVKLSAAGREQVINVLGPGEAFNTVGILLDAPCPATVVALEAAELWQLDSVAFLSLLDEQPRLARQISQRLAERVLHLVGLVEDLSLRSVEARLARLLLDEAENGAMERRRWATQAQLASRLGTVLDVLNRALRALVEDGLVQVDRKAIRILDREGLEARVHDDT